MIPLGYITVKKIIKKCLTCKKLFGRLIGINQNDYTDLRIKPSDFPFRDIAIDYITFNIRDDVSQRSEINVLIVTCLFTRVFNLIACDRGDTECFWRLNKVKFTSTECLSLFQVTMGPKS